MRLKITDPGSVLPVVIDREISGDLAKIILRLTQLEDPDATKADPEDSITCPVCGRISYNVWDREQGYCGNCHDFTSARRLAR